MMAGRFLPTCCKIDCMLPKNESPGVMAPGRSVEAGKEAEVVEVGTRLCEVVIADASVSVTVATAAAAIDVAAVILVCGRTGIVGGAPKRLFICWWRRGGKDITSTACVHGMNAWNLTLIRKTPLKENSSDRGL